MFDWLYSIVPHSKDLSDKGSIRLLVQYLTGPTSELLSGLDCKYRNAYSDTSQGSRCHYKRGSLYSYSTIAHHALRLCLLRTHVNGQVNLSIIFYSLWYLKLPLLHRETYGMRRCLASSVVSLSVQIMERSERRR